MDDSLMALQIHFVNQLTTLIEEDEVNPRIKTTLAAQKRILHKRAQKDSKTSNLLLKNHYHYISKMTAADRN